MHNQYPFHFLTIAGSDNGGGAGIQADIKTATALGGYSASVITSITVQDTEKLYAAYPVDCNIIKAQAEKILQDISIHVIKIGLVSSADQIKVISDILKQYPDIPVIVDPVLSTSNGQHQANKDLIDAYKKYLFPKAILVTPNLPELKRLSGMGFHDIKSALRAAQSLLTYCDALLVKGGHSCPSDQVTDILVTKTGNEKFQLPFVDTKAGHGTGCTLSSAIACYIGLGHSLSEAILKAKSYMHEALKKAPIIGKGSAPLRHFF